MSGAARRDLSTYGVRGSGEDRRDEKEAGRGDSETSIKARRAGCGRSATTTASPQQTVWGFGPELVRPAGSYPGQRVLDVAAGSGNVALRAAEAERGRGLDLTPENFDAGRREARSRGVELEWVEADAEALPFADASSTS